MTSSHSVGWSCGTLADGAAKMDLEIEEQKLLKELQAPVARMNAFILVQTACPVELFGMTVRVDRIWMTRLAILVMFSHPQLL